MRILLLGPQGAGKGTQAQRLAALTGARHISTGDLVRAEIKAGTPLGRAIKGYNDRGELVPDDIIVTMVMEHLSNAESWIMDGFPRTQAQARVLDAALQAGGSEIDAVVALEAPDADLVERLCGRRTSEATGNIYHVTTNPPPPTTPARSSSATTTNPRTFVTAWRSTTKKPSRSRTITPTATACSGSTRSSRSTPSPARSCAHWRNRRSRPSCPTLNRCTRATRTRRSPLTPDPCGLVSRSLAAGPTAQPASPVRARGGARSDAGLLVPDGSSR